MENILSGYAVDQATWFYLSLLLIIAVFFRFGRVWSLRNLDLILLLSISPGILLVRSGLGVGEEQLSVGYAWLFVVSALVLTRLCLDRLFTRRPHLEQNLNASGMTFLCFATFAFLSAEVITADKLPASTVETVRQAKQLWDRQDTESVVPAQPEPASPEDQTDVLKPGPAPRLLTAPVAEISKQLAASSNGSSNATSAEFEDMAGRLTAILAHLTVVVGLVLMGRNHFGDAQLGLALATLYLLLPCTSYDVGKVNHVLPAALIVWAFVAYRRPMMAGGLMGLACGTLFFPVFLLPLWAAFYGRRGAIRFGAALGIVGAVLLGSLALTSADSHSFVRQMIGSIDWSVLTFRDESPDGFWNQNNWAYRVPVFVAFLLLTFTLTLLPRKKNLEHLLAHSTAIIVGTQFWYPQQGGVYVLWYLPALLLVVFRPNLGHRLPSQWDAPAKAALVNPPHASRPTLTAGATPDGHFFR